MFNNHIIKNVAVFDFGLSGRRKFIWNRTQVKTLACIIVRFIIYY